jgi:hypothetical protein
MGVPMDTALRWEQKQEYDIPRCEFPPELRECVTWHFVQARTKDWHARLKEYWDPNEDDIKNNEKFRDLIRRKTAHGSQARDPEFYHDIFPRRPKEAEYEAAGYQQLRHTVERCKAMRAQEFYGFMYLPPEIRQMIYALILCKGTVIVPNSELGMRGSEGLVEHCLNPYSGGYYYRRYHGSLPELIAVNHPRRRSRPGATPLGLIQGVSRAVHDEAAGVYFGCNQFIFPAGQFVYPRYCNLRGGFEPPIEQNFKQQFDDDLSNRTNNAPLLRDVSYAFDMRDNQTDDHSALYLCTGVKEAVDSQTISPAEALQELHDEKNSSLEVDWVERIDSIKHMTLDRLVLDFEECYCAMGCCRKVQWVLDRFVHGGPPPGTADTEDNAYAVFDWVSRPPLVIELMGLVNENEEARALRKLNNLPGAEVRLIKAPDTENGDGRPMQELLLNN